MAGRMADGPGQGRGTARRRRLAALAVLGIVGAGLAACATPSGQPRATPTEIAFAPVAVGEQDSTDLLVTNVAAQGALTLESVAIAGPDAAQFSDEFDDDG